MQNYHNHDDSSDPSSAKARSRRLSILIKLSSLSHSAISKKYNIAYSTISQWVTGTRKLTLNGAKSIIEALQQEGVECSLPWLLHGSGNPPIFTRDKHSGIPISGASIAEQEIALFRSSYLNAIILSIKDDAMYPYFTPGDQVGGVCLERDEFELMDGQYCIIESKTDGNFCRWVQKIPDTDLFNFQCCNLSTKLKNPIILSTDKILKAAPMTRHWKPDR